MTELTTRFAADADAEAIAALVNAAFKVERFFIDRGESTLKRFTKCSAPGSTCWLKKAAH